MTRGFLILIILLVLGGCEDQITEVHEHYYYVMDTDTYGDTDCLELGDELCSNISNPFCVTNDGKPYLFIWGDCYCEGGQLRRNFSTDICSEGCVSNSNAIDYCLEDSP